MLTLKVDQTKCDGCGICMAVCSLGRAFSFGETRIRGGEDALRELPRPLIWVMEKGGRRRIDVCRHCEAPVCADACVAGAIKADKQGGTVQLEGDKCVGCWSCVMECPFGAFRLVDGRRAAKCDGCRALAAPLCTRLCPTGALGSAESGSGTAARRRRERSTVFGRAGSTGEVKG